MSEVRDLFFELLSPKVEAFGYTFKKSKKYFELVQGDIQLRIDFSWDGRGGTTYLNHVTGNIWLPYVNKAIKQLFNYGVYPIYWQLQNGGHFDASIPQMYSKQLQILANNMDFKKMAAMTFEEKYPIENIKKTVDRAYEIILNELIPRNSSMADERNLLDHRIQISKAKFDTLDFHNSLFELMVLKIMCKKMKVNEPKWVSDIKVFTNKSIDEQWNMQDFDFENMEEKFNNLKF
jgi:hypothetical protein